MAGTFCDASEVLEFLIEKKVDVIITDVRMHNVSRKDVAKHVYEHNSAIKEVFCYESFGNFKRM